MIVLAHVGDVDDFRDDVARLRRDRARGLPRLGEAAPRAGRDRRGLRQAAPRGQAGWPGAMPPRLVVAPIQALLQPVPKREVLLRMTRRIARGRRRPRRGAGGLAARAGHGSGPRWSRCPGEFSLRGGILDVFPTDATDPVRIEFFGDEVESIRPFDAESQRSLDRWDNVTLTIPPSFDEQNSRSCSVPPTSYLPRRHLGRPGRAGRPPRGGPALPEPARRPARAVHGREHASSG